MHFDLEFPNADSPEADFPLEIAEAESEFDSEGTSVDFEVQVPPSEIAAPLVDPEPGEDTVAEQGPADFSGDLSPSAGEWTDTVIRRKAADPGAVGWAMDRQIFTWTVPYHDGAIEYLREIGVWTDEAQAHNDALVQRQEILATAWQEHLSQQPGRDEFIPQWYARRASALRDAGFDPTQAESLS